MKNFFTVLLCFVMILSLSGCDLNPIVNLINGRYEDTSDEIEGTKLDDDSIVYYEDAVSSAALIEFKDSDGNIVIDTGDISKVYAKYDAINGYYHLELKLTDNGTLKFADATEKNIGKAIAIYINGELISSPIVNDVITTGEVIIGSISTQEELFNLFDKFTK